MTWWRQAGLNYIQFSNICANVVRRCLKKELQGELARKAVPSIKTTVWENGKPVKKV